MIGRDYGMDAAGWRIQDLTEPMSNIMLLENDMRVALESSHQFVVMTFKDASPALKKYDHYEFLLSQGMRRNALLSLHLARRAKRP